MSKTTQSGSLDDLIAAWNEHRANRKVHLRLVELDGVTFGNPQPTTDPDWLGLTIESLDIRTIEEDTRSVDLTVWSRSWMHNISITDWQDPQVTWQIATSLTHGVDVPANSA